MKTLREFAAGFRALRSPLSPCHWWKFARGFASGNGWVPSVFLWSNTGVVASLNLLAGGKQNFGWLQRTCQIGSITWAIVAVLAMFATVTTAVSVIRRLGTFGLTRPRWWFELGRVGWHLTTISLVGIALCLSVDNRLLTLLSSAQTIALNVLLIAFPVFFFATSVGYVLSFLRRLPRSGRAYDCVHFYYSIIGSVGALTCAVLLVPQNPDLSKSVAAGVVGGIGVLWLFCAFMSITCRFEKYERYRRLADMDDQVDAIFLSTK